MALTTMGLQRIRLICPHSLNCSDLLASAVNIGKLPIQSHPLSEDTYEVWFTEFPDARVSVSLDKDQVVIMDDSQVSPVLVDVLQAGAIACGAHAENTIVPARPMPITHQDVRRARRMILVTSGCITAGILGVLIAIVALIAVLAWWILSYIMAM